MLLYFDVESSLHLPRLLVLIRTEMYLESDTADKTGATKFNMDSGCKFGSRWGPLTLISVDKGRIYSRRRLSSKK